MNTPRAFETFRVNSDSPCCALSSLGRLLLVTTVALGLSACGVRSGGRCTDYVPLTDCSDGYHTECQTTRGGCRQCSCEANRTSGGVSMFDPDY